MSEREEMKELIDRLNKAAKAYYAEDREIMSNFEYDRLYDRLQQLEEETGMILANSPSVHVGYEAVDELPKERHEKNMLSLGKTKSRDELKTWLKGNPAIMSWKLDGLTVVLRYYEGKLAKAVTRGNGEVGEVITNNAKVFKNVPLKIAYQGELILRGEAVITYSDFDRMNESISDEQNKYKNPRNLCSGSVRQLNNEITAKRNVRFYAFTLVKAENIDFHNSREQQLLFLKEQGFDIVEYKRVSEENILDVIEDFEKKIETYDVPSDGLVLSYDDLAYSSLLGTTAKFPRDSIAFKWQDELAETTLKYIEWSASRTGLINPVAVFEPVELEGTTVSRASVHNVSIMRAMQLGIGDRITVYKANMIIPQIADNLTKSGKIDIPEHCPVCGGRTEIRKANEVEALFCMNPDCEAKKIKAFTLFVSRDAMNIDGLSEATLEKFIGKGYIHSFSDLFHMDRYREEIVSMEGFGEKSYQNLMNSVEMARNTTLPKVIFGLGIANVGLANAKMICREFQYDVEKLVNVKEEELAAIDGVGPVIARTFCQYFEQEKNRKEFYELLKELKMMEVQMEGELTLQGKVFVVTGSLLHFENRNALKEEVEKRGGKVTGSVTSKTAALINNDTASTSSKNKKAVELQVPILSEQEFMEKYL